LSEIRLKSAVLASKALLMPMVVSVCSSKHVAGKGPQQHQAPQTHMTDAANSPFDTGRQPPL
jgi:hypothetical protein